jgi:hypothetical protein
MPYKQNIFPKLYVSGDELTKHLIGIGFRFFGEPAQNPNIEDTLVAASIEGIQGDFRTLSLLVDWLEIHGDKILADRLVKLVLNLDDKNYKHVRLFWTAFAQMRPSDIRFKKLLSIAPSKRMGITPEDRSFLIERNGEDLRFLKTCLRVPNKLLRHRPEDILNQAELVQIHPSYRFRVLIGPIHRADMFAELELSQSINTYALAKRCYGSYRTAMAVKKDFLTLESCQLKAHFFT